MIVDSRPVPGHCGTCGIATNRLPCWNCELEKRIEAGHQPVPAAAVPSNRKANPRD